jgi:type IV secretory pathway VirB4 component
LGWFFNQEENQYRMAQIYNSDRETHFYIIGSSGTGKTKLLEFLIYQDIIFNRGLGVIDQEGDLTNNILGLLTEFSDKDLSKEVILLTP